MQGPVQTFDSGGHQHSFIIVFLYTQNTQFPMFGLTGVVGGISEYWVRPPSAAHRGQNPGHGLALSNTVYVPRLIIH